MSCKKWEESIYLYHELTADERKQVDVHLQQCAECRILFKSAQRMQRVMHQASGNSAPVKDPVLLTNRIMKAIPSASSNGKITPGITFLMDSLFTRYALGAVSLLLIFFFVNEQQKKMEVPGQMEVLSESKTSVPLNTKAFMEVIKQERMKPEETSLYLCIKSNQCDFGIVKNYKQRKNHENI